MGAIGVLICSTPPDECARGTAQLAACLLKFPAMTWKIVAGIHWEALKLWSRDALLFGSVRG
ncbi:MULTISPECIES: DUF1365 family protein [unclassified Mesorhizobium]|uniref:DUF1365 family protein n=1 Tax=unclassified Mesorhizobium TaxID=325217 RepID=UPI001126F4D6|nr:MULTISPECIES: DUF1365 family protein [unclassified Mesorhizobium]MCA0033659.1 DUF1365 domain-containing protein [Mesorhizobium sp. B263B2A]TPN40814.1 DUF1365 domain-containing protein [Mesorhizobium sp. B1-1-9]TPN42731.1 DUF1365 domain-containing protein [Mesorhizobium sp. B1-1-7]